MEEAEWLLIRRHAISVITHFAQSIAIVFVTRKSKLVRVVKMTEQGTCEVLQEPSRSLCKADTDFMTDEAGGAAKWICLTHIRENRKVHGGH